MSDELKPSGEDDFSSFKTAASKIGQAISNKVKDATQLEITTMVADADADFDKILEKDLKFSELKGMAYLVAFTRFDADGDIVEVLHGDPNTGELKIDEKLMEIHKQNREIGVETWNRFFTNLLTISATIWTLIDPHSERVKVIEALRDKIKPIGKTSSE